MNPNDTVTVVKLNDTHAFKLFTNVPNNKYRQTIFVVQQQFCQAASLALELK